MGVIYFILIMRTILSCKNINNFLSIVGQTVMYYLTTKYNKIRKK